ncbi:MAG TPA: RNA polymerase sigma factor [Solirubrobacteraceae bacterium]
MGIGARWLNSSKSAQAGAGVVDARVRARFRDGDSEAVRTVYRAYGRLVYAVAHRILNDPDLCEEAMQQTFVKAWRAAARVDPTRELGPWLATIARRVAIDLYRRESLRRVTAIESVPANDPALSAPPVSAAAVSELWEVRRAVSALPEGEREVVRLQHFEGLTHAQIAERLGLPLGTIKSRSFRAHGRLAADLGHLREEFS